MRGILKTLGLVAFAAVAVLATNALVATADTTPEFTAKEYPAILHGEQVGGKEHTFTFEGKTVACKTATSEGKLAKASSELELTPSYSGCTMTVGGEVLPATITNPCKYVHTATGKITQHTYLIDTDLECPPGQDVQIHTYKKGTPPGAEHKAANEVCTFTIEPETNIESHIVHNRTASGAVEVTPESKEFEYTRVQGTTVNCGPESGGGSSAGDTTITATNEAKKSIAIEVVGE